MREKVKFDIKSNLAEIENNIQDIYTTLAEESWNNNVVGSKSTENFISIKGEYRNKENLGSKFGIDRDAKSLLDEDFNKTGLLLQSLGNADRLNILINLMKQSMNVNELTKLLNYDTTGKTYHHINALMASGLIQKDHEANKYKMIPAFCGYLLIILTGISAMSSKDAYHKVNLEAFEQKGGKTDELL